MTRKTRSPARLDYLRNYLANRAAFHRTGNRTYALSARSYRQCWLIQRERERIGL